jgi:hypothetical protein
MIKFVKNDGGRSKYFKGDARDCVVRAIAIASGKDYKEVYQELRERNKQYANNSRSLKAKKLRIKGSTPRNGNYKEVYGKYIEDLGFKWVTCMKIGQGVRTHVAEEELPKGTLILRLSRHIACVKDGVLYDTFDCSEAGNRAVYGYWIKQKH